MAQFVTHIQPTLVEASHHHLPHHYKEHKDHDKHHKDYHAKDHSDDKKHGKTKQDHHHRHESNAEAIMKDTQMHQGHPRDFPVLPHGHPDVHHHEHNPDHQKERKRDSGSYVDSHGNQHTFQLHFVDSQGIHRDYHGHAIDENPTDERKHKEKRASVEDKSPLRSTSERPTPPKFIDLHSVHSENKISDGNTSFLRAARNGQLEKVLEYLKTNIDINTSNANGLNALHLASKDGHVEIVEELLKRGAIVDAATKKGNTALHIASLAGQEEVVKLLVQHGASVNVQSQNGFTPLYMAAQENHDNVVKFLLANGANQSLSTEDGFTPLAVAMQQGHDKVVTVLLENDTRGKVRLPALHIAAKKDDVRAAKLLLENDHNPDVTSKSGFTPLHIASHYGNQPIANLLIQKGADVNYSAKHNITPLHVAAKWGKSNMVSVLLEQGAHIEAKTRDGLTPLHCAARSGHEQVVDMLLEKSAPISSKTKNGLAPLHMAAQGDHVDAARILLYHRAPVDEVTVDYLTALHVAAHCGHVRVAKLLLDRQADANARALNGFTPLHIACKKNRIKVVELLLKHGACIGATTESGLTPLHVASFMGCMNIVIYLLQHDASPDIPTVRGETPLHLAARANQTDIIRILLRNGAQVDARAREQQTPLHVASRLGNVDIVMLLLQHGAKIDNTTKDMYTSLHIAAKEGQDEVVAVLIENGASLNSTTKKGFTPLHLAAKYGHLKVAKLLVQKEAPVDAQGKNGVTPLHVASHYDHQNVALLLLEKGASPHADAKNGHTPLHIAARKNQMDIAHTLLEYGAKPDVESKAGFTPLHLSSQEGHVEISSLLLEHRATPDYQSKNGLTPMHLCAQENKVAVAEILHKNGADIDTQTKGGYTPLHIASHYGQADMVKFLLSKGANVKATTSLGYTPLHQAAQQGHTNIVNLLLENSAQPNAVTNNGQTPLHIAQKLGYITVIDTLKKVTESAQTPVLSEEKYRVVAPELMHETFLSDSEEEGEDTLLGDQTYRYLTADEMKSLGDDSLPIDVTRDERIDSNRMVGSDDPNAYPPRHIEDSISPEHIHPNYVEYIKKATDNVDISRHPVNIGKLHWKNFLVSFLVDARGGAMRGCRHSGVRVIVPPRCAPSPTRITCRYVRPQRTPHPPPLMEGEALASRVLELGPVGAKFLGPVIIEVPHFAALRGKEREIVILRSDNGESWKEHTVEATEDVLNEVLRDSFDTEDLNQLEDHSSGRTTRIITQDFPQYFAVISRIRQEVHAIGPEGGMVSSTVVPQVQAVFPQGALTKKIKVGLQAQPIDPELTAKLLGHGVAVSPVVTVEPRRRKFHKAITLSMPAPRAHSQGMINQYSGSAPTLRLLCSITGGTSRAQWEDVTGSTPLTFVNDCVSFTTTVSARFWLMDCRNIGDATKMATELYREAIHVPFIAKFVVFAKRIDPLEARLRVFCMTDDKEEKTLEYQEQFTEIAKSRDVEVMEGKSQFIEFAGNLVPITKSGEQLQFSFRAFKENRLPFSVRVKDQHAEAVSRCLFMREPKVQKGEAPQQPICILNIVLPDDIVSETISLTDSDSIRKKYYANENFDYYRQDPRLTDISNHLGDDWVELADQLGLTSSEINVIKSEYPDSVAKQAQSMLRMWLSQLGNKVQTNTLEIALRRIGREDIANQCLNIDNRNQEILRIRTEEKEKHRLISDNRIEDISKQEKYSKEEKSKLFQNLDKYSAEEKTFEPSDEEEDFNKTVPERREQIVKRLSTERTIPASSQRVEIVQEITSIKRQSLVEDKIAEVQQKANIEPMKMTTIKPVSKIMQEKTSLTEKKEQKISTHLQEEPEQTEKTRIDAQNIEKRDDPNMRNLDNQEKPDRRDSVLLEEVTQLLETRKPSANLTNQEDPNSPKFSKTPPPSPADFIKEKQATTNQEWSATEDIGKFSRSQSDTVREDISGKTTSAQYLIEREETLQKSSPDFSFPNSNLSVQENITYASTHSKSESGGKELKTEIKDTETNILENRTLPERTEPSTDLKFVTFSFIEKEKIHYDPFEVKAKSDAPEGIIRINHASNLVTKEETISIIEKQDEETSKEHLQYECQKEYPDNIDENNTSRNLGLLDNMKVVPNKHSAIKTTSNDARQDKKKHQDVSIKLMENTTNKKEKNDVEADHETKWSSAETKKFTHEFVSNEIRNFDDVKFIKSTTEKSNGIETETKTQEFSRAFGKGEEENISENLGVGIQTIQAKAQDVGTQNNRKIIGVSDDHDVAHTKLRLQQLKENELEVKKATSAFIAGETEKYDCDVQSRKPQNESNSEQNIIRKVSTELNVTDEHVDNEARKEMSSKKRELETYECYTVVSGEKKENYQNENVESNILSEYTQKPLCENEKLQAAKTVDRIMKKGTNDFLNMEIQNYHDVKYQHVETLKLEPDEVEDHNQKEVTEITDSNESRTEVTNTEEEPRNETISKREVTTKKSGKPGIFSFFKNKSKQSEKNETKSAEDTYEYTVKDENHMNDKVTTKKPEKGQGKIEKRLTEDDNLKERPNEEIFMSSKEKIEISGRFLSSEIEKYHDVRNLESVKDKKEENNLISGLNTEQSEKIGASEKDNTEERTTENIGHIEKRSDSQQEKSHEKKKSGIMRIFKRKSSKETKKESEVDQEDKTNAKLIRELPQVRSEKKSGEKKTNVVMDDDENRKKLGSEELQQTTNDFLNKEIKSYHDVKYTKSEIIKEEHQNGMNKPDLLELLDDAPAIGKPNYLQTTDLDDMDMNKTTKTQDGTSVKHEECNLTEGKETKTRSQEKYDTVEDKKNQKTSNTESLKFLLTEEEKHDIDEYQQNYTEDLPVQEKSKKIETTTLNKQKPEDLKTEHQPQQSLNKTKDVTTDFLLKEIELYHDVKNIKSNLELQGSNESELHDRLSVKDERKDEMKHSSLTEQPKVVATKRKSLSGGNDHQKTNYTKEDHDNIGRGIKVDKGEHSSYEPKQEMKNDRMNIIGQAQIVNETTETSQDKQVSPKSNKRSKPGIFDFVKDKLKIGNRSRSEDDSVQEENEEINSELVAITSSFLLEEKSKYEDKFSSSPFKSKMGNEDEAVSGDRKSEALETEHTIDENAPERHFDKEETQRQKIFEPVERRSPQNLFENPFSTESLDYTVMENGEKTSSNEFVEQDREVEPATQLFFEKEKNYECEIAEDLTYTSVSRSENLQTRQSAESDESRDNWFGPKSIQTTTNFLILEKQFYDTPPASEDNDKKMLHSVKKPEEVQPIDQTRKESDDLQEKINSPDVKVGDKVSEESENENTMQTRSGKKKGILGFLKKKSKEVDEVGQPPFEKLEKDLNETSKKSAYLENLIPTSGRAKRSDTIEHQTEGEGDTEDEIVLKKKAKSQKKTQKEDSSSKGILGFLFKKKKPKDKDETPSYQKVDDYLTILEDTKTFLNKETEMYHDVRDSSCDNANKIRNISEETDNSENQSIPSIISKEQPSQVKNVCDFVQNNPNDCYDDSRRICDEEMEVETRVDIPEYTSFDFIREEVEMFEKTKLPCTSKVDSSIRIETEVENIDGEFPKEIITKKIIISETLLERKDNMESESMSQEILRKLMEVNEELKAQMNEEKSDELPTNVDFSTSNERSESFDTVLERKLDHFEQIPQENIIKMSKKVEKTNGTEINEFLERIEDVELVKSNIVEDVSILEGLSHIAKDGKQEIVTDLDDITSDSSMDSRNVEELDKMISNKYSDCFDKNIPKVEMNKEEKIDDLLQLNKEGISEEKGKVLISGEKIDGENIKKRGSITKLNEQGALSDVIYANEDFVTNLELNYYQHTKEPKEEDIISKNKESISSDEEKTVGGTKRKPLFRIESEEENMTSNFEVASATSEELDNLLRELRKDADEPTVTVLKVKTKNENEEDSVDKVDIETIERKLCDLGKALETLEQLNECSSPKDKSEVREGKLRRIERKFEHMASETDELATANKQTVDLSKSAKNEQYQQLVSQLSQDEVMSFQGDYNNLWDEYTFSKTDEWDSKTPDSQADVLELPQDTSCKELTDASQKLPTNIQPPQPRPRHQKSKEQSDEQDVESPPKQISPVRDDLLDETNKTEDISYQDKKKFWENIAKEPSKKTSDLSKRNSVQEISAPPVPKPRGTLQSSHSVVETTTQKVPVIGTRDGKDHAILKEKEPSEPTKLLPRTESKPEDQEKSEDIAVEETTKEIQKSDSVDTEENSSQAEENAGYISDSGDVEHYISDSEIEDRVPQIRERQMSVFVPPSVSQRTRYERSASLPTEDLYEVSARSTKLRKQYYEEQIKKEMIQEQLTIDLEDEGSPERKSISSPEMKLEETSAMVLEEIPTNEKSDTIFESELEQYSEEVSQEGQRSITASKDETAEIHVDKSETEKSEKVHTLSAEQKQQSDMQETIPEITFTLSGKQRRISEESDEDVLEEVEKITPVPEHPEAEEIHSEHEKKTLDQGEHEQDISAERKEHADIQSEKNSTHREEEIVKMETSTAKSEEIQSHISSKSEFVSEKQEQPDADTAEKSEIAITSSEELNTSLKSETSANQISLHEETKLISYEIADKDVGAMSEPSRTAAEEKLLAENILDDGIADIDLESEDLKNIVSRLESMHKFRKLKASTKIPCKKKVSESIEKKETSIQSTTGNQEKADVGEKIKCEVSKELEAEKHEYQEKYATESTENIQQTQDTHEHPFTQIQPIEGEIEETHFPQVDHAVPKSGTITAGEMEIPDLSQFSSKHKDLHEVEEPESSSKTQAVFGEFETPEKFGISKDDEPSSPSKTIHEKTQDETLVASLEKIPVETLEGAISRVGSMKEDEESTCTPEYTHHGEKEEDTQHKDSTKIEYEEPKTIDCDTENHLIATEIKTSEEIIDESTVKKEIEQVSCTEKKNILDQEIASSKDNQEGIQSETKPTSEVHLISNQYQKTSEELSEETGLYTEEYSSIEKNNAGDTERVVTSSAPELFSGITKTEMISEYTVINQPQENIENTVWEVSIESEMLKEEKLSSLATSCKRESIDTKTDSMSDKINDDITTDETNLESEKLDQEPSDSLPSHKFELDSHDDMKKIILESLHQQKVDPEEAKIIANSLIEEIELELQKVENFNKGLSSKSESLDSEKHVSDYLKELAETKGLDQREVELVESVLERRKRQISKLSRGDTQASSMEITDEDLRYSETDYDYSNVLQQQMGQLEAEYSDHLKNVYDSLVEDQVIKDSSDISLPTKTIDKKQTADEQMASEKSFIERKDVILEEDENVTDDLDIPEPTEKIEDSIKTPDDAVISTYSLTTEKLPVESQVKDEKKTEESIDGSADITKLQSDIDSEDLKQTEKYSTEEPEHIDKDNNKESIKRTSSSDSKSSVSSSKTPEDIYSTCSSGKKLDSEISTEVVFRKSKKHEESSARKADRKSGIDLETYSSSGESHYHSFEIDSKSRPCSSDLEGIVPTGSSEYESALNSQEISMKSQVTSGEYHTAISSLSSKQSMMSIESESSGNLASIEVSETSETLVPTNSDLEGDMDMVDQQMFEGDDLWQTSEFENQEPISEEAVNQYSPTHSTGAVDIPPKMKRSHEMTFQPEPRVLATDSPQMESNDIEEKFGTSIDDGSALSVSLSSTSSAQLPTVIELSRTESGGPEESITSAFSDHMSLEDDILTRTPDNVVLTDSSTSTNSVLKEPIESVTILSATITTNGISSVCSQVTTETVSSSTEAQRPNHEELKRKGHRRQDSTSFIPTLIHGVVKTSEPQKLFEVTLHSQDSEDGHDTKVFIESSEKQSHEKAMDLSLRRESSERRDSHGKSSSTSSEKSSFEEAEAEAAFSMVAHISPVHKIKQICPIIEDIDAEKIESEARELAKRERIERAQQIRDASPGSIPDIKVTEHMAPLDESKFRYPELEIEREEMERESRKSDTESPAPNDAEIEQQHEVETEDKVMEEPDSLEDNLCETEIVKPQEKSVVEEKTTKDIGSVEQCSNEEERTSDSPNSDSFELVEKPDIIDDFVVIEEIGKEASEMDSEGKSMAIQTKPKSRKKRDEELDAYLARSDPTPLTKMTELKYFPPDTNYELEFEFEDSPPQAKGDAATKDYGSRYDQELEANRKWIEQQFHGDQAAMAAAGYGYEMEFERGPLEDIKEEDINDIDLASSRIGSLGSQKESGGSLGSIKDSYSSTPEYDVLAGRRYFTRSGEHDDISMSSLQEFENLERAMSLETKKMYHGSGSQESTSNGSFKTRYYSHKGQGDDISVSSLKEFEGLEKACIAAHRTEIKVKEEEELLSQIDESQEIVPDTNEKDATDKSKLTESDEEDYEKRMFEIDEIIRQAQNNVERFTDLKEAEKTESLGRGDSIEEVSKVPDLDLDAPLAKSTTQTAWKDDDPMVASTDSLDLDQNKPIQYGSTDSLDQKNVGQDVMTASTDSIEFNNQLSKNITTDSMDNKTEGSNMVCSDSLEIAAAVSTRPQIDSLEDDDQKIFADHSSSDTGKDFSSSVRDDVDEQLHELMLGSTDSLEPTSSTATHATYQYETDSVFSGSFTSGGSNTMVSSTDTIDPNIPRENVDIAAAVRKVWFDEGTTSSGRNITTEFFEESSMPYVTEVIEPSDDPAFSHTIHRRVQMPVEVRKVTFHGEDADEKLEQFIKDFGENEEEIHETEEVDADGNIHTRRIVQKRFIVKSEDEAATLSKAIRTEEEDLSISRKFEMCPPQLTTLTKTVTGETSQPSDPCDTSSSKAQAFRRRPLRYDISVDDQTEVDPREHDWRFYLNEDDQQSLSSGIEDELVRPFDQHQLSSEMKELLKEMEEASKK
ncbi:uncharacterized protein LOC123309797 isoform X1 [Coccinella septempunctata]|uniref:uncharacterized protein LOC123309797 isoform X1 n=1 Tax=Coccinella septempunctata TaxID=41139 RepID=UPI001D062F3D|nr:uncharacterized protein LOC123309797 isoform X1 [Coccinella septempunctata]